MVERLQQLLLHERVGSRVRFVAVRRLTLRAAPTSAYDAPASFIVITTRSVGSRPSSSAAARVRTADVSTPSSCPFPSSTGSRTPGKKCGNANRRARSSSPRVKVTGRTAASRRSARRRSTVEYTIGARSPPGMPRCDTWRKSTRAGFSTSPWLGRPRHCWLASGRARCW